MNLGVRTTFDIGDGRMVTIETGKLAKQADGSAVVTMGNTMLLATVCCKKEAVEGTDFMPLQVEYQEKYAAVGRFPGGFFKREARPSEYEILIARLVDRAIRPLFPKNFHAETQVVVTLISGDKNNLPDALACLAASSAIAVSNIPFECPISEVRVGRVDGKFVVNPTVEDMEKSDIDMIVAASMDNIMMVEGEMKEISEDDMVAALNFAKDAIKVQCQAQLDLAAQVPTANPKREYCHETDDEAIRERMQNELYDKVYAVAKSFKGKQARNEDFDQILADFVETIPEEEREEKAVMVKRYYDDILYHAMRNMILDERIRLDGRHTEDIRPIWIETGYLPSAHGSAIFTRGETQSLTTCTLGTKLDEQTIDGAVVEGTNRFLLHYNFPPFSVGEVKRIGSTSRREIGHGNLANRALKPMIPFDDPSFPYTVRLVSDILESNGSSSMATVCAGTLALLDCGVKMKKPVSGIAMGLITDEKRADMLFCRIFWVMKTTLETWTSKFAVQKTASLPARWTLRSTAFHQRLWLRRWHRRTAAECSSSTKSKRQCRHHAKTTVRSCHASCKCKYLANSSVLLSDPEEKSSKRCSVRPIPLSTSKRLAISALSTSQPQTLTTSTQQWNASKPSQLFLRSARFTKVL